MRFLSRLASSAAPAPSFRSRQIPTPSASSTTSPAADQNRTPFAIAKGVIRLVVAGAGAGGSIAGAPAVVRLTRLGVRRTA